MSDAASCVFVLLTVLCVFVLSASMNDLFHFAQPTTLLRYNITFPLFLCILERVAFECFELVKHSLSTMHPNNIQYYSLDASALNLNKVSSGAHEHSSVQYKYETWPQAL